MSQQLPVEVYSEKTEIFVRHAGQQAHAGHPLGSNCQREGAMVVDQHLKSARRVAGFLVAIGLAFASSTSAQTPTTGQISGVVTDPSGAGVATAKVSLTSAAGSSRQVSTDESGHYTIPLLPTGIYRVLAQNNG